MALPALLLAAAATFAVDPATEGVLIEDHRAPLVQLSVELPAGKWSAWVRSHHGDDAWEFQIVDPGRSLRKRADTLAADIDLMMSNRYALLRAECLKPDLDAVLTLVKDILENERYDERELKRAARERPIQWRANETDVTFQLVRATARNLFAAGDPRRLEFEKPEPVETDVAKLVTARDTLLRLPGRVIGFAGDLTLDEAKSAAAGLLPPASPSAPEGIAPRLLPVIPADSRARDQSIPLRKLTQVYLRVARESLPFNDPRRPEFVIADHVLGGHFHSRLYEALRHDSGDSYGAATSERGDTAPGAYVAVTFTRAANAAAAEAKLKEAMTKFQRDGITETERSGAISYLRGAGWRHGQSAGDLLNRYLAERRLGLPPGYLDGLIERAAARPLDDINAFIRAFYDPALWSTVRAVPR